jgi:hypothetical protein
LAVANWPIEIARRKPRRRGSVSSPPFSCAQRATAASSFNSERAATASSFLHFLDLIAVRIVAAFEKTCDRNEEWERRQTERCAILKRREGTGRGDERKRLAPISAFSANSAFQKSGIAGCGLDALGDCGRSWGRLACFRCLQLGHDLWYYTYVYAPNILAATGPARSNFVTIATRRIVTHRSSRHNCNCRDDLRLGVAGARKLIVTP